MRTRRGTRFFIYVPLFLVGIVLLTLCGVLIVILNSDSDSDVESANTLVYGLTLRPSGIDPHQHASAELGIPLMSVYDTLVYRHPQTLSFEPGLAREWDVSENRLIYTFFLREDVTFHDGQPFDAAAVGVNLDRITNPEFGSQKARSLLGPSYDGYSIVDEFTVQIRLSQPFEPLLDGLSQVYLGMASPLALANNTDGTYQWHQVGTGPYRMVEVIPGDRIVLERNPDYQWGPLFYTVDNPNPVDRIVFRFFEDPPTRDDALQSGEVDIMGELLPSDAELLLGNSEINLYPAPIPGQPLQYIFNTQRFPTSELNVRQALLYGTNRTAIVDAIFSQSPVAYGPLSAVTDFYSEAVTDLYAYEPGRLEDLLDGINVSDSDEDGVLDQNGLPLEIVILTPPWGLSPETSQAMAAQWEELGFVVEIRQVPNFGGLLDEIDRGEYHLVALNDFGLDASVLNSYFTSTGRNNFTGYSDPELDSWLEQALREANPTTRANLYAAAQQRIMEQALILPIRDYVNLNGTNDEIDGVIFSATGWWPLLNNFQWAP